MGKFSGGRRLYNFKKYLVSRPDLGNAGRCREIETQPQIYHSANDSRIANSGRPPPARHRFLSKLKAPSWIGFPKIYAMSQPVILVLAWDERVSRKYMFRRCIVATMVTENESR